MMRISCGVVLLVVTFSIPGAAQETVFFDGFESGDTAGWWAPARVGETGQKTCYDEQGAILGDCTGTNQDGDLQTGVDWPNPRFVDNIDGTVTDMLTGLTWLKDTSCQELAGTDTSGRAGWVTALMAPVLLVNGVCGLSDGSATGSWRLPSINELQSLFDYEYAQPALSDTSGTAKWSDGNPFSGVTMSRYWSSTSVANNPSLAWYAGVVDGYISGEDKTNLYYVWPVRGGQ